MKNKVIIIVGGTSGVGKKTALELLSLGSKVVVSDLMKVLPKDSELTRYERTSSFQYIRADLREIDDCKRLVESAIHRFHRVDGFFHYAGVTHAEELIDLSERTHDEIFNVNVKSALFCLKYILPIMKETGGSIVMTGSPHAWSGDYDRVSYACSKGATMTLTHHIARNYAKFGIRANIITMGWTPTEGEIALREKQGVSESELREMASEVIPMGRMTEIEDIVPTILFLLSDQSRMVSGANLRITGGWYI